MMVGVYGVTIAAVWLVENKKLFILKRPFTNAHVVHGDRQTKIFVQDYLSAVLTLR